MDESRLWGGIGILIGLAGIAIILFYPDSEFLTMIAEGHITEFTVLYGLGVILAVLFTMLIIGPSMLRSR
ncbi:hypothetical protein AUR64_10125 [Haloprofundus marisrubri]|uniref:Transporter n=1 Tax=Haloprofundus marisrubri TaxID=1514971 RepID=A0A0W1R9G9_9EURY|nr:hypothetical protein [Haloprofundus marisrubri]KTG09963.1 hypothetical protein AUR64_10125 [Haloprofundus marisrubri]